MAQVGAILAFAFMATVLANGAILKQAVPDTDPNAFPFCGCQSKDGAYTLDDQVIAAGDYTYCFTVRVVAPRGCQDYCCTTDLHKLEIKTVAPCDVGGTFLSASVTNANGLRRGLSVPSVIELKNNINGAILGYVFKVTGLGLNTTTANGARICVRLGPNSRGRGCTTLEQLCAESNVPGTCTYGLFNTKNDCCPGINTPPPPSPRSPTSPESPYPPYLPFSPEPQQPPESPYPPLQPDSPYTPPPESPAPESPESPYPPPPSSPGPESPESPYPPPPSSPGPESPESPYPPPPESPAPESPESPYPPPPSSPGPESPESPYPPPPESPAPESPESPYPPPPESPAPESPESPYPPPPESPAPESPESPYPPPPESPAPESPAPPSPEAPMTPPHSIPIPNTDANRTCQAVCIVFKISGTELPPSYTLEQCATISANLSTTFAALAEEVGANVTSPFLLDTKQGCTAVPYSLPILCGKFASADDAAKVNPKMDNLTNTFVELMGLRETCRPPEELVTVDLVGDGDAVPGEFCLSGQVKWPCDNYQFNISCNCTTTAFATPFGVDLSTYDRVPGNVVTTRPNITLYCFNLTTRAPFSADNPCANRTILNKVEMIANYAAKSSFFGFYVQPIAEGRATPFKYVPPSWGALDEPNQLLKVSGLSWNSAQANGARICLAIRAPATMATICGQSACGMYLFDLSRRCCPLYVLRV